MQFKNPYWKSFMAVLSSGLLFVQIGGADTFIGSNTGAIPDGTGGPGNFSGAGRVVSFDVSGLTGDISDISLTLDINHTFVGDLDVVLTSPNAVSFTIFSRLGALDSSGYGFSSDLITGGNYVFSDAASNGFWSATFSSSAGIVSHGSYHTVAGGPQAGGEVLTSFATSGLVGLTPAQANGTWTLTFRDGANVDTGSINAASLDITVAPVPEPSTIALAGLAGVIVIRMARRKR